MVRVLALVALSGLVAACGSHESAHPAQPQTADLRWHENCGTREERFPISTRRLVVGKGRWQVELAFRNETHATLTVMRPHIQGGTYFGLEPFETTSQREVLERADRLAAKPPTIADRFSPTLPRILPPGTGWSG